MLKNPYIMLILAVILGLWSMYCFGDHYYDQEYWMCAWWIFIYLFNCRTIKISYDLIVRQRRMLKTFKEIEKIIDRNLEDEED